jgi:uncharacterized OB-fold protein
MAEYVRPLPVPDGDTKPYWDAAKQHRLVIQRCDACDHAIFYPRSICPECMSDRISWIEASGSGTIYSYTVVHRAPAQFADDAPYVVALIDLTEGVRLMSNVVGSPPADVHIGARVSVVFDDVTPDVTLPKFRLVAET